MPRRPTPRGRILVAGDINLDLMTCIEKFTGLDRDYLAPAVEPRCGGVGVNTALALARWGMPVRLLGAVGKDWFGRYILGRVRKGGVDASCVQRTPAALTGLLLVVVSQGQRTFFGSRGANSLFAWRRESRRWLRGAKELHLVGYSFLSPSAARAARALLAEAQRRGLAVSFDVGMAPAQSAPQAILQVARSADILFLSQEEAALLTGKRNRAAALRALEQRGAKQVVMKLGRAGCLFREKGRLRRAPGFAVRCVDTTGCGDAFTAAFLQAWRRGWRLDEAALAANAAGAAAAMLMGAGENMPGRRETLGILASHRLGGGWEQVRRRLVARLRRRRKR